MPSNNAHRRALRSVSPRKETRIPTGQQAEPLPPAGPPPKRDEPAGETTGAIPKAGGKMPAQNSHRKAMRSGSPRKEARKTTDKGSNPPPPAETTRPPPEAEEPEVELRRPSIIAKLKGVMKSNKEKSATGAGSRVSAAPSAEPAVRPKDNPRPTSLPAQSKASRPKKHPGQKQYEGSVRLREVLGEPTKRRDHGLDESQMRLETQARHKDEERKKARDRSLSTKRSQSNRGSFKLSKGVKSSATAFFSPAFMNDIALRPRERSLPPSTKPKGASSAGSRGRSTRREPVESAPASRDRSPRPTRVAADRGVATRVANPESEYSTPMGSDDDHSYVPSAQEEDSDGDSIMTDPKTIQFETIKRGVG